MGLLDVLSGMQNGPRGEQSPNAGSGGMSPVTMAVLGLIAYKALRSFAAQPGPTSGAGSPSAASGGGLADVLRSGLGGMLSGQNQTAGTGGGLGGLLSGGLGGLLAGSAAGGILSGGLGDLLQQFQQSGHGDIAKSWISNGPNQSISPDDLAKALGSDQIKTLMAHSGLSRDDLLAGLRQYLPDVVNELTPDGRLPTEAEMSRRI